MTSQSKAKRRVRRAVAAFCDNNGYVFVSMSSGGGKKHGKIKVRAEGYLLTVGWASSSKAGIESTCLMVVDHLKRKLRDAKLREER